MARGVPLPAAEEPVWVDAGGGTVLAAHGGVGRDGQLEIARLGRFRRLVAPAAGGPVQRTDMYSTVPAGSPILLGGQWSKRQANRDSAAFIRDELRPLPGPRHAPLPPLAPWPGLHS